VSIRFLHTADWQLGKPFRRHPEGDDLGGTRLDAIERIAEVAADREVDFVLVAGDVFDANTVDRTDVVLPACARLETFEMPVYLLPGNHDFVGAPDAVLTDQRFRENLPEHVHVLTDRDPVLVADGEAVVLPSPLEERQPTGNTLTHLDADTGGEWPDAIRVGLAHGSVTRFDENIEGEASNYIDPNRAEAADLDYLALGDWHGKKRITEHVWYSGTPEPDGYADNDPGYALVVDIEAPGAPPDVEPVSTGRLDWLATDWTFESAEDLEAFSDWIDALGALHRTVLKLDIEGVLGREAFHRLDDRLADLDGQLFELRRRGDISPAVEPEEVDFEAMGGYVERATERLLDAADVADRAEDDPDELRRIVDEHGPWHEEAFELEDLARRALRTLHRLTQTEGDSS